MQTFGKTARGGTIILVIIIHSTYRELENKVTNVDWGGSGR